MSSKWSICASITCTSLEVSLTLLWGCRSVASFSPAQMAFIEEFYGDNLQTMSSRHSVRVFCGADSIRARGKVFRMQVRQPGHF